MSSARLDQSLKSLAAVEQRINHTYERERERDARLTRVNLRISRPAEECVEKQPAWLRARAARHDDDELLSRADGQKSGSRKSRLRCESDDVLPFIAVSTRKSRHTARRALFRREVGREILRLADELKGGLDSD